MQIDIPTKPWYASKTVWLNAIGLLVLVLGIVIDNATPLALPPQALAWLGVLLAVANGVLRFVTSQPIGPEGAVKAVEIDPPDTVR